MKEALFYKSLSNKVVQCKLCPHFCVIKPNERGECGVRENHQGKLFLLVYGRLAASGVDPIEKKPLYHFHPGEPAFSVATVGCNLSCLFCQNCTLSQSPKHNGSIYGEHLTPLDIVTRAKEAGCRIVSYTYSEPTIAYEYWFETMKLAKKEGMLNTWVTNGFINPEPLRKMAPLIGAANIDLKSLSDGFYQRIAGGRLREVLNSIRLYHKLGIWVEVTTLIIPGENDSVDELKRIASFISGISNSIPWHISRFFPFCKMLDKPPTPIDTLYMAAEIGKKAGLRYVYVGNVLESKYNDTICPKCGAVVIKRKGFDARNLLVDGKCPQCGTAIEGIF